MENKLNLTYVGYYALAGAKPERFVPLAGRNKMDYTINVLSKLCGSVEIVSPAVVKRGETSSETSVCNLSGNVSLKTFRNIANKGRLSAYINFITSKLMLFWHLLRHTDSDSTVLCYHSLAIIKPVLLAKKIRKFKLILELNEIYSDVVSTFEKYRPAENKIISAADAYMFPNDLMNAMFNKSGKPFAIQYGIYTPARKMSDKYNDGKFHVVYAGTLDPSKGGAAAAAAAAYLPINYHIHILGFGSKAQMDEMRCRCEEINKTSQATVTYDGMLDGDEFINFLQKCHIGLSTQNPTAKFNATSFPSKILTYFANGLQVVSIDIPAISKSKLSESISFYHTQSPDEIAKAILNINNSIDTSSLLSYLDREFSHNMENLLLNFATE